VIYQLLEKVTVLSRERIRVTLRDGLEIEQAAYDRYAAVKG
jgi:hypothetical protein